MCYRPMGMRGATRALFAGVQEFPTPYDPFEER